MDLLVLSRKHQEVMSHSSLANSTTEEGLGLGLAMNLAVGFQKCVGDLWEGDDFSDFNVVVEGTTYRCHRFILAACSDFFQGLFRSNMKECQENSVKIEGIHQETFRVVLHSVYRGAGGITLDNFLDVWRASEQLQIGFLIDQCQSLAFNNLSVENCFKVLDCAKMFASDDVVKQALRYICKKFKDVSKTVDMILLPFDEFYKVINSDYLFTTREDVVLETVINWLSYIDHSCKAVDGNTKFRFFKFLNKISHAAGNNEVSNVKSGCLNKNLPNTFFRSSGAYRVLKNGMHFPTQIDQSVKPESRKHGQKLKDLIDDSTLDCLTDSPSAEARENQVATSKKRSHSQASLDEDIESFDVLQSKIRPGDRRHHLIDLVRACRLCLVSSEYLEQVLETNQMLSSCPETRLMLSRALVYSLNEGRRHDCWPDQAVRRVNFYSMHVMIYWYNNSLETYDIRTGRRQRIENHDQSWSCSTMHLVVFANTLYSWHTRFDQSRSRFFVGRFSKENGFKSIAEFFFNARMLAHNDSIYSLGKLDYSKSKLFRYRVGCDFNQLWHACEYFHAEANCLVRFNQYILIFHTVNDVVIPECYDTKYLSKKELPARMEGTSEGMTSFTHGGDVFLLQTNGSLWKIVNSRKVHPIEFELVSHLWDDIIIILGLAMFQSKLHLFVNLNSVKNVTFSENLPTSLPQIVRIPLAMTAEMVPMVIPTAWLQE